MKPTILIRHSNSTDAQGMMEIYHDPLAYSGTLNLPYPSLDRWQKKLNELAEGVYFLVAEIDKQIVGHIVLQSNQLARRRHVGYIGMAVKDAYQGQGIGSKLLASAIELAEQWLNLSRIELTVYSDNLAAIALYKKYGFTIEGEAKNFAYRDGTYADAYFMAKIKSTAKEEL